MLFEIISLFIEDKWFHGIFIQIISLWYISFWWTIWSKNSNKIRSKKHNACKVKHIKQSPFRENIFEMLVKKIHPQRFSAFFQIQFHPWNTFLITLYYIFTVYIYAHLEEAISRDQIFEAPHTAKIFHHEFRRRQLWFDDDHQATNVITRVLRPFASSPSRSLWKSHAHDGRKARIHAEESSV